MEIQSHAALILNPPPKHSQTLRKRKNSGQIVPLFLMTLTEEAAARSEVATCSFPFLPDFMNQEEGKES